MPKINVYLPEDLASAVREAQLPVSAVCQNALERAVRDVTAMRSSPEAPVQQPAYGPFMRFTPRARQAIAHAQTEALKHDHGHVGTEHLLLGILDEGGNLALKVLHTLDVEADDVRSELVASLAPATKRSGDQVPFAPLAKKALELTSKEALGLGHNYVGCEHLLLGILATEEGLASQVLRRMGVELRTTRRAVVTTLAGFVHSRQQEAAQEALHGSMLEQILHRLDSIEKRLPS
jgi:ATP-dependent Clp protease ATP-binding subunit ClpA